MKTFNRLTEKQMSKQNGGSLSALDTALALIVITGTQPQVNNK